MAPATPRPRASAMSSTPMTASTIRPTGAWWPVAGTGGVGVFEAIRPSLRVLGTTVAEWTSRDQGPRSRTDRCRVLPAGRQPRDPYHGPRGTLAAGALQAILTGAREDG